MYPGANSIPKKQKVAFIIAGLLRNKFLKCFFSIFQAVRLYIIIIAAYEVFNSIVDKNFAGFAQSLVYVIVFSQTLLRELYYYKCNDEFVELLTTINQLANKPDYTDYRFEFSDFGGNKVTHGFGEELKIRNQTIFNWLKFRAGSEQFLVTHHALVTLYNGLCGKPTIILNAWHPFDTTIQPMNAIITIIQGLGTQFNSGILCFQEYSYNYFLLCQSVMADHLGKEFMRITNGDSLRREDLIEWIKMHQKHYKLTEKIRNLYEPILFVWYFTLFSVALLCCIVGAKAKSDEIAETAGYITFPFLHFIGFKITCGMAERNYYMEELINRCLISQITSATSISNMKVMLVAMTRSSKLTEFTAFGLFPLSNDFFLWLVKGSFSFVVTLVELTRFSETKEDELND